MYSSPGVVLCAGNTAINRKVPVPALWRLQPIGKRSSVSNHRPVWAKSCGKNGMLWEHSSGAHRCSQPNPSALATIVGTSICLHSGILGLLAAHPGLLWQSRFLMYLLPLPCGNSSIYFTFTLHCINSLSAPDPLTSSLSTFSSSQLPSNIPSYFPICLFSSHSRDKSSFLPYLSLPKARWAFLWASLPPLVVAQVHSSMFTSSQAFLCTDAGPTYRYFDQILSFPLFFYNTKTSSYQTFVPVEMHLKFRIGATKFICVSISSPRFISLFLSSGYYHQY